MPKPKKAEVRKFGDKTITELYALVLKSEQAEEGIDALCGDEAAGCNIIRDLLAEVRRLKTALAKAQNA